MRSASVLALYVLALGSHAQLFTAQGANITVNNGAQLTVRGGVLATSGCTINNGGTIDLTGDFTNHSGNDLFGTSQGTVIANGTAQTIGGSSVTVFNNLVVTAAEVTLAQDVSTGGYPGMAGVLSLGPSHFFLNSHELRVLNPSPGAITRTTGYLISETDPLAGYGEVQWFIAASAPGNYVFPFGSDDTNTYLPVTVNTTTAGSGASGSITCSTYPTDPFAAPNNRPLPTGLTSLTDLGGSENAPNVVDRFWPMRTDDYSIPPTASITFTYRDSEWGLGTNIITEPLLQAQRFNGSVWSQPPLGTVNTAANTVTTSLTNDYDLVWALVQGSSPLPVELLVFDATPHDDDVVCTWTTASERNNDFFTVERSAGGEAFTDIGEVDGAGNSHTTLEYVFVDEAPLSGLSYYRLRQTDDDGVATWSDMVTVWRDAPSADLRLYPNPCRNELFIAGALGGERAIVLDATGRVVMDLAALVRGGVDVSGLPAGSYSIRLTSTSGHRAARFVKQ